MIKTLNEALQLFHEKNANEIRQFYSFAKSHNFDIGWRSQLEDKNKRIYVTIYPEGKANYSPYKRQDSASFSPTLMLK